MLTAKDRDAALEYELFAALRTRLAEAVTRVQLAASLVAQLDTLCSFAAVAVKNNYCRPERGRIRRHRDTGRPPPGGGEDAP